MGLGKLILLSGNSGGGPAPFTPLDNPGVRYFFNGFMANTFAVTGGKVTTWFDSGPNNYNANAGLGGGPDFNANYRNGKAAAIFSPSASLFFGNVGQIETGHSFHIFMLTNSADAVPAFSRLLTLATNGITVGQDGCVFFWAADPSYNNFSMGCTGSGLGIRGPNIPLNQDILLEISWDGVAPFGINGAMSMAYNGTVDTIEANTGIIPEPNANVMGYNGDVGTSFSGPIGALYQCDQLADVALAKTRAYFLNGWALS